MANGGARPGAGRPQGTPNRQSLKLQELVREKGDVSPGRVMLEAMWFHYGKAAEAQNRLAGVNDAKARKDIEKEVSAHLAQAHAAAKDVAPFIHTRLSSVIVQGDEDGGPISHRHAGLVGLATLTQADLAKLDTGQLAALYREAIGETSLPAEEPATHPDRNGGVPA